MARRNLENIAEKILTQTIKIAGNDGLDKAPAKRIARECDITDATIFVYYETKENLLASAYKYALARFDESVYAEAPLIKKGDAAKAVKNIFAFAVENADIAKYISVYRHSAYWDRNEIVEEKVKLSKKVFTSARLAANTPEELMRLWYALENLTVELAINVADGRLMQDEKYLKAFLQKILRFNLI